MRNRCVFGYEGSGGLCSSGKTVSQVSMPKVKAQMASRDCGLREGQRESLGHTAASAQRVRFVVALPEGRGTLCYCSPSVTALILSVAIAGTGGRTHLGSGYLVLNVSEYDLVELNIENTDPLLSIGCRQFRC